MKCSRIDFYWSFCWPFRIKKKTPTSQKMNGLNSVRCKFNGMKRAKKSIWARASILLCDERHLKSHLIALGARIGVCCVVCIRVAHISLAHERCAVCFLFRQYGIGKIFSRTKSNVYMNRNKLCAMMVNIMMNGERKQNAHSSADN